MLGVDADRAERHLEEAHRHAQSAGDQWLERNAAFWLAYRLSATGDLREALAAMEASVTAAQQAGDGPLLGSSLMFAAVLRQYTGDPAGADAAVRELEALGDEIVVAGRYVSLSLSRAFLAGARGEWDACTAFLTEWATTAEIAGNSAVPLRVLAVVEALIGRHAESAIHNAEASRATEGDVPNFLAMFPADLAPAIHCQSWRRLGGSRRGCPRRGGRAAAPARSRAHVPHGRARARERVGRTRPPRGRRAPLRGARADGESKGLVWDSALLAAAEDGAVEACRDALGSARFDGLWSEGAAMTWDEVVAFAQRVGAAGVDL